VAADGSSLQLTVGKRTLTLSTAGTGALLSGAQIGDSVRVTYTRSAGVLTARVLTVLAVPTILQATGIVQTLAVDGSSVAVQTADGHTLTLATAGDGTLLQGLLAGQTVTITYAKDPDGTLVLTRVQSVSSGSGTGTGTGGASGAGTGLAMTGSIAWIDWRHGAVAVRDSDGRSTTFAVADPGTLGALHAGEAVQVTYVQDSDGSLTATGIVPD
jgi:hypothetical protein